MTQNSIIELPIFEARTVLMAVLSQTDKPEVLAHVWHALIGAAEIAPERPGHTPARLGVLTDDIGRQIRALRPLLADALQQRGNR